MADVGASDWAADRVSLAGPGVRALIVGTGTHVTGSELTDVPAVATTARDLGAILVSRCGLAEDQVRVLVDPPSPADIAQALHEAAAEATDVLVFAYIGHGLPDPDGELHLASRSAAGLGPGVTYQALAFGQVRQLLEDSRARSVLVILDCCYAGRAQGVFGAAGNAFAVARLQGGCLLAAAARDEVALAPVGQRHTAFTGALIGLLDSGDPAGPTVLTADYAFRHVERTLIAHLLPRPERYIIGSGGDVLLGPNRAYEGPELSPVPGIGPGHELASCPYRGLSQYQPGDAEFFFGRKGLTATLASRMARHGWQHGPLVVLGPSGTGKSSLLAAGLVPALNDGRCEQLPGSAAWPVMTIRPGVDPLGGLTARLGPDETGTESRRVLIVDQFEELFTQCADPAARIEFARELRRRCAPGPGGGLPPTLVVIVMRADFYSDCTAIPALAGALELGPVLVGPMTDAEVREAIEGPAQRAGLALEHGLADRLLHDLGAGTGDGEMAGSLPLLSYALMRTWQRRSGRVLTLAGYQASGGIADAVKVSAEKVYSDLGRDLGEAGQRAARRILLGLVRISDSAQDTRGRVPLADLIAHAGQENHTVAGRVLDQLVEARLVDVGQSADEPASAQIAHEALMRAWPRLREWISQDRAWLLARQSLAEAARVWAKEGRDRSGLYRGQRLAAARTTLEERRAELPPAEAGFLDASIRREQAGRRRRVLAASLAVLLVVAGITAASEFRINAGKAQRAHAAQVLSQQLAAQSNEERTSAGGSPHDTDLDALAAWTLYQSPLTRSALLSAGVTSYDGKLPDTGKSPVSALAATSNGRLVAAGDDCGPKCGTLRIWDTETRRLLLQRAYPGSISSVAFSPIGTTLAVTYLAIGSGVQIWDTAGTRPRLRSTLAAALGSPVAFSPDGRTLAAFSSSSWINIALWDVASGTPVKILRAPPVTGITGSLAFSPSGHLLAGGSGGDGTTRVWNTATGRLVKILPWGGGSLAPSKEHAVPPPAVAFSPDGAILATCGIDASTVQTWHVPGLTPDATLKLDASGNGAGSMGFSPDGGELVAGDTNDLDLWDPASGRLLTDESYDGSSSLVRIAAAAAGIFSGYGNGDVVMQDESGVPVRSGLPVQGAAIGPGDRLAAAGGADGYIRLWSPRTGSRLRLLHEGSPVTALAFSPDGGALAAAGPGQLTVWNPGPGTRERSLPLARPRDVQVLEAGYTASGSFLVAAMWPTAVTGPNPYVEAWATRTWKPVLTTASSGSFSTVALAPAGNGFAVADGQGIQLWNLGTGKLTAQLPTGTAPSRLAFVPGSQSRLLLAGNSDGTVTEWDIATRRPVSTRPGGPGPVRALAVSPDGTMAAVAGQASEISIYSLADGRLLTTLAVDTQRINSLVFSHDGTRLLSTSDDGVALWWNLSTAATARRLCQAVSGPGLADAWRQATGGATAPPC